MHGRKFTREFKLDVCRQLESGAKRPSQVVREYGLAAPLVSVWRSEFKQRGENAFTPKERPDPPATRSELEQKIAELERICGQLYLENELLKKLGAPSPSRSATR
jgi:transposase-like protein